MANVKNECPACYGKFGSRKRSCAICDYGESCEYYSKSSANERSSGHVSFEHYDYSEEVAVDFQHQEPNGQVYHGETVWTTKELAREAGTRPGNIRRNFERKRSFFFEGDDFYLLQGDELKEFISKATKCRVANKFSRHLILWTESGAIKHREFMKSPQRPPRRIYTADEVRRLFEFILRIDDYSMGIVLGVIDGRADTVSGIARTRGVSRQAVHRKVVDSVKKYPELKELFLASLYRCKKLKDVSGNRATQKEKVPA